MIPLAAVALAFAVFPALMYVRNVKLFRAPGLRSLTFPARPHLSVLIPARNEEAGIAAAVEAVLASTDVDLELIVLDDHSTDRTAEIVRDIAVKDGRVRVELAPPLPADWCGKQHACHSLSKLARFDIFTFLDADVRLSPDALARMVEFQRTTGAALVSGFPRQETGTLLEKLVIPLINWLLACYLPIGPMRKFADPRFGAGCGQWFLTTRAAYEQVGGHAAVKESLHDGVKLPRAYRQHGFFTDICDATDIATCRMYRSAGQVWFGLAKNAREGLGSWPAIIVWTVILFGGQVLPFLLLPLGLDFAFRGLISVGSNPVGSPEELREIGWIVTALAGLAAVVALAVRLDAARRYRASWLGAVFHPVGVSVLLTLQWYATVRAWLGIPVGWKGRAHPSLSSGEDSSPNVTPT